MMNNHRDTSYQAIPMRVFTVCTECGDYTETTHGVKQQCATCAPQTRNRWIGDPCAF